jgi:hypothetical protein
MKTLCALAGCCVIAFAQESVDLAVVHKIKAEANKKSQVMDHLFRLADVHGPRLTASPNQRAAAEWSAAQFRQWGFDSVRLEEWGPFGRSWALQKFGLEMMKPQYAPLIAVPLAWSSSTKGPVTAGVVLFPVRSIDMEKFAEDISKLRSSSVDFKGKMVMINRVRPLKVQLQAAGKRYSDAELTATTVAPDLTPPRKFDYSRLALPEEPEDRGPFLRNAPPAFLEALREKRGELRRDLHRVLREKGVVAVLTSDGRSDGGTVFGEAAGPHESKYPLALPTVSLTPENYNRIARFIEARTTVSLELELKADISTQDVSPTNVLAEIKGTSKPEEVIMIGAHMDSWTGGTGATDNAVGCAVAMEAVRILKTLKLPLTRTVRVAFWTGEEQGLLGSKAYVKKHFADPKTMEVKPEHAQVSAYFNLDNGSGRIRGVWLQGNDAARPVFERWLSPFRDLGVSTISLRDTFGTDHLSFDEVGIPGFQFIQDPLEYSSRTHHSNMDTYDHVQSGDLMQASAVMASVVYHAANRPDKMPRKPLPEPEQKWTPPPPGQTAQ